MKFFKKKPSEKFDGALTQGLMGGGAAHGFSSDLAPTSVASNQPGQDQAAGSGTGYQKEGGPTSMERLFGFNAVRVTRQKSKGDEQNQRAPVPEGPRKPKQTSAARGRIKARAERRARAAGTKESLTPVTPTALTRP